jgi:hypothetical protein
MDAFLERDIMQRMAWMREFFFKIVVKYTYQKDHLLNYI